MDKYAILKEYFGHDDFREGQAELIDKILAGYDVLGIMPTGAGKSICYQVPALMLDGITLVVSPLISLMKDQVSALVQSGIKAAYINSSLTSSQYSEVFRRAYNGTYKIIYVAPERLLTEAFINFAEQMKISMVTVDEAHCVSQWGQDFRPSYMKIVEFIERLSYRPIISAFTATATKEVREDIGFILRLNNPFVITTGFDRENLYFGVMKPNDKFTELKKILENNQGKCGIIYCIARKTVEEVCDRLNNAGFSATRYHAGLSDNERHTNQDDFIYDRKLIMVATNAFGMGIDKSNVSFVVHYNMPKNLESYYQEAGRAGRDGEPADCILLYSGQDVRTNQFLIENSEDINEDLTVEMREAVRAKDRERLKMMTIYCTTNECLREYILRYFDEKSFNFCGNCSNCNTNFETVDITIEAQKIVSCIYRIHQRNRSFGKTMIVDILHGSKSEKIKRWGLVTLSTYGIMTDIPTARIRTILDFLIENEYLIITSDEFATIKLSTRSAEIIRDKKQIEMKLPKEIKSDNVKKAIMDYNIDSGLFSELKTLRNKLATEEHVPAYVIFADAALHDMCRKLPVTKAEFLNISGVGSRKAEKYSDVFCNIISRYTAEHPDLKKSETQVNESYRDKVINSGMHSAYNPWESDEDSQLIVEFNSGMCIKEMSDIHKRTTGAIRSRLKKLNLEE